MAGGFVLIVGPSGAGKDTLIALARAALAEDRRFSFPERVVTRPSDPFERHDTVTMAEFRARQAAGAWALAWEAHGNCYAVPVAARRAAEAGQIVVVNISRGSVAEARAALPVLAVVEVTAAPEVLAARIAARGRDGDHGAGLASRMQRSDGAPDVAPDLRLINEGAPAIAAAELKALLLSCTARQIICDTNGSQGS